MASAHSTEYQKFRSGLTYQDAAAMLWVDSDNPDDWHRKSKGVVLGLLSSLKRSLFEQATGMDADGRQLVDEDELATPPDWDVPVTGELEAVDSDEDCYPIGTRLETPPDEAGPAYVADELPSPVYPLSTCLAGAYSTVDEVASFFPCTAVLSCNSVERD